MPEPERGGGSGFVAIALIVLGLLILVPSGLCTGAMAIFSLWGALSSPRSSMDFAGTVLAVGGPFIVVGGVLTWLGFRMRRRR